jgi:hypothetical protein
MSSSRRRLLRLCLALWLFAFLAGTSYALGPQEVRVAQTAPAQR